MFEGVALEHGEQLPVLLFRQPIAEVRPPRIFGTSVGPAAASASSIPGVACFGDHAAHGREPDVDGRRRQDRPSRCATLSETPSSGGAPGKGEEEIKGVHVSEFGRRRRHGIAHHLPEEPLGGGQAGGFRRWRREQGDTSLP